MKVLQLSFLMLLAIFTSAGLRAQSDSVMHFSLSEAQDYAISNFHLSKNAELDIKSAKWKIWETTAIGLPQVSASGSYQRIPGSLPPPFPINDSVMVSLYQKSNTQYGVTVNQLIFSGEYIVGLQASKVYKSLSETNYEKVRLDIKENVAGTYYTILVLESNKTIVEQTISNLKSSLEQTQKIYNAGLIEDVDVDQISLTVKQTESQLTSLNNQIQYMQSLLKYQLGLDINTEVELTEKLEGLVNRNIVDTLSLNFILEDNVDYQLLSTQEKLQKLNKRREISKYLPTLSGYYNYVENTNAPDFPPPVKNYIGLNLSFSIFESGSRIAKIQQAKIAQIEAENTKNQEGQRLVIAAQQARWDYEAALDVYMNELENYELSKKVYEKTEEKYQKGLVSSLDLTIINNQFLQAHMSYTQASLNLLNANVSLNKAYNKL